MCVHGLLRVTRLHPGRQSHLCTEAQLAEELQNLLDFTLMVLRDFGFDEFEADLSTRPDKYVGDPDLWDKAEEALRDCARDRRSAVSGRRG